MTHHPGHPVDRIPEEPNYATTDVDPTPGSPRPAVADEPNYATTDIDPTTSRSWSPAADEPNYATTDIGSEPGPHAPLADRLDPDVELRRSRAVPDRPGRATGADTDLR